MVKHALGLAVLVVIGAVGASIGVVGATAGDVRTIGYNETKSGEIGTDDPWSEEFDGYYEPVAFSGSAGDFVVFDLTSDEGETYMAVLGPSDNVVYQGLAKTSGWPHDGSTRLGLRLPRNGQYTVVVASTAENATLSYELSVTRPETITVSSTVEGEFTSNDTTVPPLVGLETRRDFHRHYGDMYAFHGQSSDDVAVTLTANSTTDAEWDTYLFVIGPDGRLSSDDKSGPGNDNARITRTLGMTGKYVVVATSEHHFSTFPYELSVTGASGPPATTSNSAATQEEQPTAKLELENVTISNTTVHPNETVTVNATLKNDGEVSGDLVAWLGTGDDLRQLTRTSVRLDDGERRSMQFTVSFERPGTHGLVLSGRPIGTVTVEDPTPPGPQPPNKAREAFERRYPHLAFEAWYPLFDEGVLTNETDARIDVAID